MRELFGSGDWVSYKRLVMEGCDIAVMEKNDYFSKRHWFEVKEITAFCLKRPLKLHAINDRRKK